MQRNKLHFVQTFIFFWHQHLGHEIFSCYTFTTRGCLSIVLMGVDPGGDGGIYPPKIWGGGDGLYYHPPQYFWRGEQKKSPQKTYFDSKLIIWDIISNSSSLNSSKMRVLHTIFKSLPWDRFRRKHNFFPGSLCSPSFNFHILVCTILRIILLM